MWIWSFCLTLKQIPTYFWKVFVSFLQVKVKLCCILLDYKMATVYLERGGGGQEVAEL